MRWRQFLKNLVRNAGKMGQELKNAYQELKTSIRSMDKERIPDHKQVIRELKGILRAILSAGKEKLEELWEAIQELKDAIQSIIEAKMPDMQNVFHSIGEWWWDLRNTIRGIDFGKGPTWLGDLGRKAKSAFQDMGSLTIDKAAEIIAALGVPGLVLVVLMAVSPWYGAAAMTWSLAVLGGPLGMAGGIALLLVLVLIAKALAKFGFEQVFQTVLIKLIESGKTCKEILEIIDSYLISKELKKKLKEFIEKYSEENDEEKNDIDYDEEKDDLENNEEEDNSEQ